MFILENPIEVHNLVVPLFQKTPTHIYIYIYIDLTAFEVNTNLTYMMLGWWDYHYIVLWSIPMVFFSLGTHPYQKTAWRNRRSQMYDGFFCTKCWTFHRRFPVHHQVFGSGPNGQECRVRWCLMIPCRARIPNERYGRNLAVCDVACRTRAPTSRVQSGPCRETSPGSDVSIRHWGSPTPSRGWSWWPAIHMISMHAHCNWDMVGLSDCHQMNWIS